MCRHSIPNAKVKNWHLVDGKGFSGGLVVKNSPAKAGDLRDMGSILGSGRSPGEENGNPLRYSCLGNPMDRGAWRVTVCMVTELETTEYTLLSFFLRET